VARILFVYPNKEAYPIIPIAISLLSGILKQKGHQIDLFDVTFMLSERSDHKARETTRFTQPVNVEAYWGSGLVVDIPAELRKKLQSFHPDLVAFSIVENNYGCARRLFEEVKETMNVPVLVGGMFPTVVPDFFIHDPNVDLICLGEGEETIVEIAKRIDLGQDFLNIPNLVTKSVAGVSRGGMAPYYRWEPFVLQDWNIFDQRHIFKPFMGEMRQAGYFELSRGCAHQCFYCNNLIMQELFKEAGRYVRQKPSELLVQEVACMKDAHDLNLICFNDENFLQMNEERFKEFCRQYQTMVGLPFFMQTRADTLLKEDRVRTLKDIGCVTIGIGVEHGNETIRKKVLNKNTPNSIFEKAFQNCKKAGIRTTAYIMMGLPFETEENILETAAFCKKIEAESVAVSIFAPYYGTELRRVCVQNGFMDDRYYDEISINWHSILSMPQISKQRIEELYHQLHSLIFGDAGDLTVNK